MLMKKPLACLLPILLLLLVDPHFIHAQNAGIPKVADIAEAFEALPESPLTIKLKNTIHFDQEGGHLQGIQLYKGNTIYLSGSSSGYSYMVGGNLEQRTITSIDTLLLSPLRHAGGFQIYDHFLAVGIEDNQKRNHAKVQIYDLEKDSPWKMPLASLERKGAPERVTAGAVGLTAFKEEMWLLVANWDSRVLDFYTCPEKDFYLGNASFQLQMSMDLSRQDRNDWINPDWLSYQNLNLFTDKKGQMYVTGTAQTPDGKQLADLFQLIPDTEKPVLTKISSKIFSTSGKVNFKAAAGLQVSQEGRLLLTGASYQIGVETCIDLFSKY